MPGGGRAGHPGRRRNIRRCEVLETLRDAPAPGLQRRDLDPPL